MTLDDVREYLAPYGATLDDEGRIVKGDKVLSVAVSIKGKRLHVRGVLADSLLFSGHNAASIGKFVESYWYWEPRKTDTQPTNG